MTVGGSELFLLLPLEELVPMLQMQVRVPGHSCAKALIRVWWYLEVGFWKVVRFM